MNKQNTQIAVAFVAGVLVGLGSYWLISERAATGVKDTLAGDVSQADTQIIVGDNGVIVEDQAPGLSVTIAKMVLSTSAWVAIHDDVDGVPGKILGAKLFDTDKQEGTVELLRATESGKSYIAVIHENKGEWQTFSPSIDTPLLDDSGKPVSAAFTVTAPDASDESINS